MMLAYLKCLLTGHDYDTSEIVTMQVIRGGASLAAGAVLEEYDAHICKKCGHEKRINR